jgi:hypothetical protein
MRVRIRRNAKNWHWGVPAKQTIEWVDPDIDRNLRGKNKELVEIGRFSEIRFRPIGERKITRLPLPESSVDRSHVTFDWRHPKQRIYLLTDPSLWSDFAGLYREDGSLPLADYAQQIGSVHGTRDYPSLKVTPLGRVSHILYVTEKGAYWPGDQPDGLSTYIHRMGEEKGVEPGLAVDRHGRIWYAGGSYTCPRPGIMR